MTMRNETAPDPDSWEPPTAPPDLEERVRWLEDQLAAVRSQLAAMADEVVTRRLTVTEEGTGSEIELSAEEGAACLSVRVPGTTASIAVGAGDGGWGNLLIVANRRGGEELVVYDLEGVRHHL